MAPYFLQTKELLAYGKPVAIYAQQPTDSRPSRRSVETVEPLAQALNLRVLQYHHSDFAKMVKAIRKNREYEGKTVLICWQHKAIPKVAAALGVTNPPDWSREVFDRIWVITFKDGKANLRNLPQKLMYGDSSE